MKQWKKIAGLALASLLLIGCNGGNSPSDPSSGAIPSSEEASTSSYSDPSSSSGTSSSLPATPLAEVAEDLVYARAKYSSSATSSWLLDEAKKADPSFDEFKEPTYADMFLLSYLAFKDCLGERVGARIYEWYMNEENPSFSTYDDDSIYTTAFRFFSDAGIVEASKYGTSFDARKALEENDFYLFLQHIHYYIGSSAQDDFYGYANKEQRLKTVEGIGPDDPFNVRNLVNDEAYGAWISETVEKVPAAKCVDESIRGVGENNLFKEALLRYDGATSVSELYSLLVKDIEERGYSPLYDNVGIDTIYKNGDFLIYLNFAVHDVTGVSTDYVEDGKERAETISLSAPYFSSLLDDEAKGQSLAEQYADYLHLLLQEKEKHPEYSEEIYFIEDPSQKIGSLDATFADLASALGLKDPTNLAFSSQKACISFFNLFKDENLAALKGLCANLLMNHYKVLLPDTDLFNHGFFDSNMVGSRLSNGSFLRNQLFPLYGGNLVNYYASTEEYAANLALLDDLAVTLKGTMKEKLTSSAWLSEEGKEKTLKKLDNMKSVLLAKQDNGETLEYVAPQYAPLGSGETAFDHIYDYDLALWERYESLFAVTGDACKYGLASVLFNPLTINAFYAPNINLFVLLPGFMFAIGQPTNMTQEEIMASYGWIIAHEMGHGYDTNGFNFDHEGNYDESYMPSADRDAFNSLAERYSVYLGTQEIMAGIASDPSFILVEAVADNIGLSIALSSGLKKENFSAEKFFVSCGQNFGGHMSRATAAQYAGMDSHPVNRARINAPFRNFSQFHETFGTKEGDFMYLSPESRIVIY